MLQKGIANHKQISTTAFHLVFVHSKLTFVTFGLVQVLLWWNFKSLATDLKLNWLQIFLDLITWSHDLTEVIIINTIKFWDGVVPLFF